MIKIACDLTTVKCTKDHTDHITAKANRSLGFVKRNLKRCPENIKEQAYKSLVRPHLEYASTVWSLHQKYQIDKPEAVQRKAARFIKNLLKIAGAGNKEQLQNYLLI